MVEKVKEWKKNREQEDCPWFTVLSELNRVIQCVERLSDSRLFHIGDIVYVSTYDDVLYKINRFPHKNNSLVQIKPLNNYAMCTAPINEIHHHN